MCPIADDAEALELLALHLDPVLGETPALLAEFHQRGRVRQVRLRLALGAVVLLLDLPFDRQAVTIPAGHVIGIEAEHLLASGHHVLENFVERVADMDVAVGVGRTVMQDKARPSLGGGTQPAIEIEVTPARQQLQLFLRQAGAHWEVGLGQEERLAVIARFRRLLVHGAPSNKPPAPRKGPFCAANGFTLLFRARSEIY